MKEESKQRRKKQGHLLSLAVGFFTMAFLLVAFHFSKLPSVGIDNLMASYEEATIAYSMEPKMSFFGSNVVSEEKTLLNDFRYTWIGTRWLPPPGVPTYNVDGKLQACIFSAD